jgi:predicted ferric reductase
MNDATQAASNGRITTADPPATRLPRPSGPALGALYIGFCALPLVLATLVAVAPADPWEYAAAALGIVALGGMAVQFVTSGRFESISGKLGIDKIMAFHKVAAWWLLIAALAHPLAYVLPTWLDDPARGTERLLAYLTLPHYRPGVITLGALALIVLTSTFRDRLPFRYEVWRASHIALGALAVGMGMHHAVSAGRFSVSGPVYWFWIAAAVVVVGAVAIVHGWRWLHLHRQPWRLASVTKRADRMWELDIQPDPGTPPLPYHAGQFVWMTEGPRRIPIMDHPFSIADSPSRPGLSLIIKEAGDFTRQIGTLEPGTAIGIDGPYGEFAVEEHEAEAILLIAGGVGIAPVIGILRDMAARRDPRPVRLAYGAGHPDNFACLDDIEAAKDMLDLRVMLLSEEDREGWTGEVGMLDHDRLRRLLDGLEPARTVALMCGPGGMVTAVSDALLDLGMPMDQVVYERFDYSGGAASRQDRRRSTWFAALGLGLGLAVAAFALIKA